jgi:uncharacterized membrane protein
LQSVEAGYVDKMQIDSTPFVVRGMQRLESHTGLDVAVRRAQALASALVRSPRRRDALQGRWLGHAVHPLLTDIPIGMWTSTNVLDLVGGEHAQPAADLLLGLGVLAAVPTAVTGLAEFAPAGEREKRVALVHATTNSVALTCYASSFVARRRGNRPAGMLLALCGSAVATVGGYLGGHLTAARKVSTRHPEFDQDGSGTPVDLTRHRPVPSSPA